jgi:hypothetical protein
VDGTNASISATYTVSARWAFAARAGWGRSRYLGESGRIVVSLGPPLELGPQRNDTYADWGATVNYTLNEHLKAGLDYSWFQSWSTSPFADFVRQSWAMNLSSRW